MKKEIRRKVLMGLMVVVSSFTISCNNSLQSFAINDYIYGNRNDISNQTVYLARCEGDIYVEIPDTYYKKSIQLTKTDNMIWYRVPTLSYKVSNKGWEYKNE